MTYRVVLTRDAVRDLEELYDYLAAYESESKAEQVLARIEDQLHRLTESPERGTRPRELLTLGISEFRQVYFKPYRILYKLHGKKVYIVLIADGRRDMKSLLQRRLLGA